MESYIIIAVILLGISTVLNLYLHGLVEMYKKQMEEQTQQYIQLEIAYEDRYDKYRAALKEISALKKEVGKSNDDKTTDESEGNQ